MSPDERIATATGLVEKTPEKGLKMIMDGTAKKGDVLSVARSPASWALSAPLI